MVAWPASLPTLRLPAEYGMRDNVERLPMDVGPPETRRRSTVRFIPFSFVLRFTDAQAITFRAFWENDLADGSLPFDQALGPPINATVPLLFQAAPRFNKSGRHHVAAAQFWILG